MSTTNGNHDSRQTADVHVQEVIRAAESELVTLLEQRSNLMKRITGIRKTLVGLAKMFGDDVLSEDLLSLLGRKSGRESGITEACRAVLVESVTTLTLRQVCEQLGRKFPRLLERNKNPVASVSTVLRRLVGYEEAKTFLTHDGKRLWEWVAERPSRVPAEKR